MMTKLTSLSSHSITHVTNGQIAREGTTHEYMQNSVITPITKKLDLTYDGPMAAAKYVSMVDETGNKMFPCVNGTTAAAAADATNSGVHAGAGTANKVLTMDTKGLNTDVTLAVCYTEGDGSNAATWTDSGIRLTISKVTTVLYGTVSPTFPVRTMSSTNVMALTNKLPQAANEALVTYDGDLANDKYLSLVDASLNLDNGGPCVEGSLAGHAQSDQHSSGVQAANGTKAVTFPQQSALLRAHDLLGGSTTFAVCYAENGGTVGDRTFRDSYIRVQMSRVASILSHSVTQLSNGQIAAVGKEAGNRQTDAKFGTGLSSGYEITYTGSLPVNKMIAIVAETSNGGFPCASEYHHLSKDHMWTPGTNPGHAPDPTHSGPAMTSWNTKISTFDTSSMSTDHTYAVCYTELQKFPRGAGAPSYPTVTANEAPWYDSGIRVTISKVRLITYGTESTSFPIRTMPSSNIMAATNRLPQEPNAAVLSYVGDLAHNKWVSFADASINAANGGPCNFAAEAAHAADSTHSGVIQGVNHTSCKMLTHLPLGHLFDNTKLVAVPGAMPGGTDYFTTLDLSSTIQSTSVDGSTNSKYSDGVLATNGKIFLAPFNADDVGVIDPATGGFSVIDISRSIYIDQKYRGGVLGPDGRIFLVPCNADLIGVINPVDQSFSVIDISASINTESKYWGGVMHPDGKIYFAPHNADNVGVLDPAAGSFSVVNISGTISTDRKYAGGVVAPNGKVYFVPYDADNVGVFNPVGDSFSVIDVSGTITGSGKYVGGKLAPNGNIYFAPYNADNVGVLNSATDQFTAIDISSTISTDRKYSGAVLSPNGKIHFAPYDADNIGAVDLSTGAFSVIDVSSTISSDTKYLGGVLARDGKVYFVPYDTNGIGRFTPAGTSELAYNCSAGGYHTNRITVPQVTLLNENKTFALCYAEANGTNTDRTWRDAMVRVKFTKLASLAAHKMVFTTNSGIAREGAIVEHIHQGLITPVRKFIGLTYTGSLPANTPYASLVDQTLNSNFPCADGTTAAAPNSTASTGVFQASAKTFLFDTSGLSSGKVFAVCYTEGDGTASASWTDAGMRFTVSKVTSIKYGSDSTSFPARTLQSTNVPTGVIGASLIPGLNRLPQEPNAAVTYAGDLVAGKWLSVVDASLNLADGGPCVKSSEAGHVADRTHSGVQRAVKTRLISTEVNRATGMRQLNKLDLGASRIVTIPQGILLDERKSYAICYADSYGTAGEPTPDSWRDSFVRVEISKLASLAAHGILHLTTGQLPRLGAPVEYIRAGRITPVLKTVDLAYTGTLPASKYASLVDESKNGYFPCASAAIAAGTKSGYQTGVFQGGGGHLTGVAEFDKTLPFDTSFLETNVTFAVCYTDGDGSNTAAWKDAGIRFTISRVSHIKYGPDSSSFPVRTISGDNVMPGTNRLPREAYKAVVTYVGDLATGKHLSLVDASLNMVDSLGQKYLGPCVDGAYAGHAPDTLHSGAFKAPDGTSAVTFPQQTLLDDSKTFAVCYAENGGADTDRTWRDTLIRVKMTKLAGYHSHDMIYVGNAGITREGAPIEYIRKGVITPVYKTIDLTYTGSLPANSFASLVQETKNDWFPCASGAAATAAASNMSTGVVQATGSVVGFNTSSLSTNATFAACYTAGDGTAGALWEDSGIRFAISKATTITYGKASPSWPVRHMSGAGWGSTMAGSNRLPRAANKAVVTYVGDLTAGNYLSIVDAAINIAHGGPCVKGAEAGATPDTTHSGGVQAGAGTSAVTFLQNTLLDSSKTYAVCYAEGDGSTTDRTWRDTQIRLKIVKLTHLMYRNAYAPTNEQTTNEQLPLDVEASFGVVLSGVYVSFVDETRNQFQPCASGAVAAEAKTATHSGVNQASGLVLTADTSRLSTSATFAVCYTEGNGTASAAWEDAGLRLAVTRVGSITYGPYSTSYPIRHLRYSAWNNRLPQEADRAVVTYVGDLGKESWMSLVDASINAAEGGPCGKGSDAAAGADSTHSGVVRAATRDPSDQGKEIIFPQSTLLDDTKYYQVCYAETDGTAADRTWRNSHVILKMTKVTSVVAHEVTHLTDSQIARNSVVDMTYSGTLPSAKYLALQEVMDWKAYDPCGSIDGHHGVISPQATTKTATLNTLSLNHTVSNPSGFNRSAINLALNAHYDVCYTEGDGTSAAAWHNSGIRVTISKIVSVGTTLASGAAQSVSSTHAGRNSQWLPLERGLNASFQSVVGVTTPEKLHVSFVATILSASETMTHAQYRNPCASGAVAAASPDNLHSGAQLATSGSFILPMADKVTTMPKTTIMGESHHLTHISERTVLDEFKVMTLCYATGDGSVTDPSWRDSFVRFKFKDLIPPKVASTVPPNRGTAVMVDSTVVITFDESVQAGAGSIHFKPTDGVGATITIAANDATQVDYSCQDHLPDLCPDLVNRGMCHPNIGQLPAYDFATRICQKSCGNCTTINTGGRMTDTVRINPTARFGTTGTNYTVLVDANAFLDDGYVPNAFAGYKESNYTFRMRHCPALCCKHYEYASENCTCVDCVTAHPSDGTGGRDDPQCQFWNDHSAYQRCTSYLPCFPPPSTGCGPNYFLGWKPWPDYRPQDTRNLASSAGAEGESALSPPVNLEARNSNLDPKMP